MLNSFKCLFITSIVLFALTVTNATNSQSCLPVHRDCSFYSRCLEAAVPCGPNGYALGFGLPYCTKFQDNYDRFSPRGQIWMWSTMTCLQNYLIPIANGQKTATCTEIHSFAFASHSVCYTQPGSSICDLPFSDWTLLFVMISQELNDPATWQQMLEVLRICMSGSSKSRNLS